MSGFQFWTIMAALEEFEAAPVSAFRHAPLSCGFDQNIVEGLIVEVPYLTEDSPRAVAYWLGVVVRKASYLVQLKWLGEEGTDSAKYFWRHIAAYEQRPGEKLDQRVFPLGWAKSNNQRFEPPRDIRNSQLSVASFLKEELVGRIGLPKDFHEKVKEENESIFKKGMTVEATAIDKISAMKLAVVEDDVGRRLKFRYLDNSGVPQFCWFNEFSEMFMPRGWSRLHGRELISTPEQDYPSDMKRISLAEPSGEEASIFHFKPLIIPEFVATALLGHRFEIGSKLEVIDPSDPRFLRVGTIVKVLKNQYLVIVIDGVYGPDGSEHRVCLHASSPFLLPAGFAAENNLMAYFQPPSADFSYKNTKTVPRNVFEKIYPKHDLRRNQFLEVARGFGGDLICVSRIVRVVGHLILVHFEGYGSNEDQFFPISSSDLYPVGWCHLVGHRLRTPLSNARGIKDNDKDDDRRLWRTARRERVVPGGQR